MKTITKCPTCGGQKTVSKPPWVAGDQETWSSGSAGDLYPCPTCDGKGYLRVIDEDDYCDNHNGGWKKVMGIITCPLCKGQKTVGSTSAEVTNDTEPKPCPECNGRGYKEVDDIW